MKKKLLTAIMSMIMASTCAFGFTACGGDSGNDGLSAFEIYKQYHPDYTGTEQEWIESLKGSDGAGIKSAYINKDGELILELTDGTTINCGKITSDNSKDSDDEKDDNTEQDTQKPNDEVIGNIEWGLPLENITVTRGYGLSFNKTLTQYEYHLSLDFEANAGDKVFAVADGTVTQVVMDNLLGESYVIITHDNGITTQYKYILANEELKEGDTVKRGDIIGTIAQDAGMKEAQDGTHLHFEMKVNGTAVDPTEYLNLGKE